jgi:hypothetical protein
MVALMAYHFAFTMKYLRLGSVHFSLNYFIKAEVSATLNIADYSDLCDISFEKWPEIFPFL